MGREKKKLKGNALVNKVALIVIEVICWALILGYVSDFMAGNSTVVYFALFEVAAILTAIVVPITYKAKPAKMKYVAFVMFAVVYAIANIGAATDVAFVMAFPIVVVFVLYYDLKLMIAMAVTFDAICIVDCLYIIFVLKHQHSGMPTNSSNLLMEFLATTIFLIAVTVVTKISNENNAEKLGTIQSVADKVNESIKGINVELTQLNESSDVVKMAMEEINTGINNTAEAVQNQLLQTEAIQERIENVESVAGNISENVDSTMTAVEEGSKDVETLVRQADDSVAIGERVTVDLNELKDNIRSMSAITQMIEAIAFQTNIMALNANVEAAHAGEAGRGFAVVASEISNMSAQTKQATDDITDLISNAISSLGNLVESIEEMQQVVREEKNQTEATSIVFETIRTNTDEVRKNVMFFMDAISGLTSANREIVQSVSTISAVTEEVTALASEAMTKELGNADAVHSIASQMDVLAHS